MTETSFLKWVVGSVVIICSAQTCRGWGSTDGVHAIITDVSRHPTDPILINITSSLVVHNIDESIDFTCNSPVSGFLERIRLASKFKFFDICLCDIV